jgi:RNA polymerase sigma factor (sigma-70 family)
MTGGRLNGVVHRLRDAAMAKHDGATDGLLLERFVAARDERAFEALLRRHGPMVLAVCQRVLHNQDDSEDAFQATFLVLARKAASIARRELLGAWLYGVAYRAALETRAARRGRERQVTTMPEPGVLDRDQAWRELRPILDQELHALSEKHRAAIVLCDLEGRSRREAAAQLGIPEGTLSSRLATARRALARRLARHGFAISGASLAALLSHGIAAAGLPVGLASATTRAATDFTLGTPAGVSAGVSADVTAISEGVMKTMMLSKLKNGLATLLVCAAVGCALLPALQPAGADDARPAGKTGAGLAQPAKGEPREQGPAPVPRPGNFQTVDSDALEALAFSRDSRFLAAGGWGREVLIWDLRHKSDEPSLALKGIGANVRRLAFSPDGKRIAAGVDQAVIHLWNTDSGKRLAELRANLPSQPDRLGNTGLVNNLAFLPGNKLLALYTFQPQNGGGEDQGCQILIWDLETRRPDLLVAQKHSSAVDVAVSPNGKHLACAQFTQGLAVWDLERRDVIWREGVRQGEFMSRVAFSPDGKRLAAGGGQTVNGPGGGVGAEGRLWLFDVQTRKREWLVEEEHNGAYNAIAFTADSKGVLTGSSGKEVRLLLPGGGTGTKAASELRRWDVATGKAVWRADGELGWFNTVTASADGQSIAGCDNAQLVLFDPATGERQRVLRKVTMGP